MNHGRIEYAPDYKSDRNDKAIKLLEDWLAQPVVEETPEDVIRRKCISGELDAEHARLKDNVVEAARLWNVECDRINQTTYSLEDKLRFYCRASELLIPPLEALEKFETDHGIGSGTK